MNDSHIIQHDVEVLSPSDQLFLDLQTDGLSLLEQLVGIVLGHDALEHLVPNGGQDLLVIVDTDVVVDPGQFSHQRSVQ